MKLSKTVTSIILALITTCSISLATVIERETIIVSNGTRTVTLSTNGTISINNVALNSTNNGSEGITLIGAQGGYTLNNFFKDTYFRGMARDSVPFTYTSSPASNLVVNWASGDAYDPNHGYYHILAGSFPLVNNALNIAYFDSSSPTPNILQWTTGARPETPTTIIVASFTASFGMIVAANIEGSVAENILETEDASFNIFPSIIANGCNVFISGTGLTNINANSGVEYYEVSKKVLHSAFNLSSAGSKLYVFGHTAGVPSFTITNQFPIGMWDNGSNMVAMTDTNWYRGSFLFPATTNQLYFILPTVEYEDFTSAIAGLDPAIPAGMSTYIPLVNAYVYMGSDTVLRTDSAYILDRRFMIQRPNNSGSITTGSSAQTPSLNQVLLAGNGTGGILPTGMGDPTTDDQAASKHYVDSQVNNVNSGKVYVDPNGNDSTAILNSSILPYKTIQTAIDAAGAVANDTNRFTCILSAGIYYEHINMHDDVGMIGQSAEDTTIRGQVRYLSPYADISGAEIARLAIFSTNEPALIVNSVDDDAYTGVRSCYLSSTYDDEISTNKSVVLIQRGITEIYSTTYLEEFINTTNACSCHVQIFEHTTDLANQGLSEFTSYNSSCHIFCVDTNDEVSMMYTHDNTDEQCINQVMSGSYDIWLNRDSFVHENNIKLISHLRAEGRTLSIGNVTRLNMSTTNNCNLFMAYAKDGLADNVAIIRNNHVRIVEGSSSNIWFGAATGTNDNIRIYDTEIIQDNAFNHYPKQYTNEGSLGSYYINTPHQNGDAIIGGAIDLSLLNNANTNYELPNIGHVKLFANVIPSAEQFNGIAMQDSMGIELELGRDMFALLVNGETNYLNAGEAIYVTTGALATAKRALANNISTLPCSGIVLSTRIAPGSIGRILRAGSGFITPFDTSIYTNGDKLYVSATIAGGITNVAPSAPNISQLIGFVRSSATNGGVYVSLDHTDTLGSQIPSYYAPTSSVIAETNRAIQTENGLQTQINSATNRILGIEGQTSIWNTASTVSINATNRILNIENQTSTWNTAVINATNAWVSRVSGLEGRTTIWNQASIDSTNAWVSRVSNIESRTSTWNTAAINATNAQSIANIALTNWTATTTANTNLTIVASNSLQAQITILSTPNRFKAGATTNMTFGTGTFKFNMTQTLHRAGVNIYSNSISRWYPMTTNKIIMLTGGFNFTTSVNGQNGFVYLYKNGANMSTLSSTRGANAAENWAQTWKFIDTDNNSTNDYYEIFVQSAGASLITSGTYSNNWVYGEVIP